jgi:hypothetical protein
VLIMLRQRSLAMFLACVPALAAHSARADPSSVEISSARQAFEKAVSLESEQRWTEAELKLRAAVAVKDTPGLRFHLGRCEVEQGKLVEAALEYDLAEQLLHQGAIAPDVQRLLPAASLALKRRTPRVTVELAPDLRAASAWFDGKGYALSELALGLPFNPGRHELRVSAAGRRSFERSLLLKEGEEVTIRAEFSVAEPPMGAPGPGLISRAKTGPASDAGSHAARQPSAKLYVMLGESVLIAAGLALGIGYKVAASSASDRVDQAQGLIDLAPHGGAGACVNPDAALAGACHDLSSAIDDHERAARISKVGFITAGGGAVALATTWLVWPGAARKASGLALQPLFTLGQVGLQGRF